MTTSSKISVSLVALSVAAGALELGAALSRGPIPTIAAPTPPAVPVAVEPVAPASRNLPRVATAALRALAQAAGQPQPRATEPAPAPAMPARKAMPSVRYDKLDAQLESSPRDTAWEIRVATDLSQQLAGSPDIRLVSTRCGDLFCRVELTLPSDNEGQLNASEGLRAITGVTEGSLMLDVDDSASPAVGVLYFPRQGQAMPYPRYDMASK